MKYGRSSFGDVAAAASASHFAAPDDFDLFAPAPPHDFNYDALFANVHEPRGAEAFVDYDDPFYLQDHGAAADPFHDFQGLQREEEEMTGVAGSASTAASAGVELDSGFVVQDGFIEKNPFTDFNDPDDPDDSREFSGGKHKRRYTKRQQNNRRRTKKNKKMTKRKTNKKNK
jgi:hypothetical protein